MKQQSSMETRKADPKVRPLDSTSLPLTTSFNPHTRKDVTQLFLNILEKTVKSGFPARIPKAIIAP